MFAALRRCYNAPCKFFIDDVGRPNRINWYWAPTGAEIYEGPHAFTPRIYDLNTPPETLYEFTALRTRERHYTRGHNVWHTTGAHVDGDAEDFLGLAPRRKYSVAGRAPVDPCGNVRHIEAGILLGAEMPRDKQPGFFLPGGILLGAEIITILPPPLVYPGAIKLGAKLLMFSSGTLAGGIDLGAKLFVFSSGTLNAGIDLGGVLVDPSSIELIAGIELGGELVDPSSTELIAGIELGGELVDPSSIELIAGIDLGGELVDITLRGGLALGGELVKLDLIGGIALGGSVVEL